MWNLLNRCEILIISFTSFLHCFKQNLWRRFFIWILKNSFYIRRWLRSTSFAEQIIFHIVKWKSVIGKVFWIFILAVVSFANFMTIFDKRRKINKKWNSYWKSNNTILFSADGWTFVKALGFTWEGFSNDRVQVDGSI